MGATEISRNQEGLDGQGLEMSRETAILHRSEMKLHGLLVDVKQHKAKRTPQTHKPKAIHKNHWWGTDMTKFYVNIHHLEN
jgi:hypothetical protein